MASLSRYVGKDHSRVIKKLTLYVFIPIGGYLLASVIFTSWMLFRWFSIPSASMTGGGMSPDLKILIMILIMAAPFFAFIISRAIYKHSARKGKLEHAEGLVQNVWGLLGGEGIKSLQNINERLVVNGGTHHLDNDAGYTLQEEKDVAKLRSLEWDVTSED